MVFRASCFAALMCVLPASAAAGALVEGTWSASGCGSAPAFEKLDLSSNLEAYNRSVERVNAYHKSMDAYLSCMVKEANSDIQLITEIVQSAQQAAKSYNEKIAADAKVAKQKFEAQ